MLATDDPFERAEQYQAQRGEWVVGGLETQVFWPNRAQLITFEGLEFLLQPAISDGQHRSLPAIALRVNGQGMAVNEGRAAVMRLATAIAWREGAKVEIVMWGGGSHPHRVDMLRPFGRNASGRRQRTKDFHSSAQSFNFGVSQFHIGTYLRLLSKAIATPRSSDH